MKNLINIFVLLLVTLLAGSPVIFASSAVGPANGNIFGPQISNTGTVSLALTFDNFGTVSGTTVKAYRVGDRLIGSGWTQTGTGSSAALAINLPAGYQIDLTKIDANKTKLGVIYGLWSATAFYTSGGWTMNGFSDGSDPTKIFFGYKGNTTTGAVYVKNNGNDLVNAGGGASFEFDIPILGWSAGGSGFTGSGAISQITYMGCNLGIGTTNTKEIRCSTQKKLVGTGLSFTDSAANGSNFNVLVASKCDVNMRFGDGTATTTFGIIEDPTGSTLSNGGATLTGNIRLMNWDDGVRDSAKTSDSTNFESSHYSGIFAAGAKVWFATNAGTAAFANTTINMVCVAL